MPPKDRVRFEELAAASAAVLFFSHILQNWILQKQHHHCPGYGAMDSQTLGQTMFGQPRYVAYELQQWCCGLWSALPLVLSTLTPYLAYKTWGAIPNTVKGSQLARLEKTPDLCSFQSFLMQEDIPLVLKKFLLDCSHPPPSSSQLDKNQVCDNLKVDFIEVHLSFSTGIQVNGGTC